MLGEQDHARIRSAIEDSERNSRGEIFCVLAHEISRYREVPLAWGAIAALLLPPLLVVLGLHRLTGLFSDWSGQSGGMMEGLLLRGFTAYALLQAGIFLLVVLIVSLPSVRRVATPRFLRRHRVRQAARRHFAAAGARLSPKEPHILIFASLHDRQVELVAHHAIHKAVGDGPWNAAVAAVTEGMKSGRSAEGFVAAIGICGEALARHFPPDGAPRNQLPDSLLET
jgi:putative membrane protein